MVWNMKGSESRFLFCIRIDGRDDLDYNELTPPIGGMERWFIVKTLKFKIQGMTCSSCAARIDDVLNDIEGILDSRINLANDTLHVDIDDARIDERSIQEMISKIGYDATSLDDNAVTKTFKVIGMSCQMCASHVTRRVSELDGVKDAHVNLATDQLSIRYEKNRIKPVRIKEALQEIGYDLDLDKRLEKAKNDEHTRMILARNKMVKSAILTSVIMMLMVIDMWIVEIPFYVPVVALFAAPVVFVFGIDVHKKSLRSLKSGRPNMDVLVSLGSLPPYVIGLLGIFFPMTTFIEMAATIMTFHLIGKFLESRAKGRASQAIEKLLALSPERARIIVDGEEREVMTSELQIGDIMMIRPGERVPIDGTIVSGKSQIDESLATGESMPVLKEIGDEVIGATINYEGSLQVKVTKTGNDTFLAKVVELVESCQGSKVPIQAFADRVTGYFVPVIMILSVLTFFSFLIFSAFHLNILSFMEGYLPWINSEQTPLRLAFITSTAVLVIACPCALGLGTPTALMVGSGIGAKQGILIRNGEAVQTLKDVQAIAFDKTGTLTYGKPEVTNRYVIHGDEAKLIERAASLEHHARHPLATAVLADAKSRGIPLKEVLDFASITGMGLTGSIDGKTILIGNRRLMETHAIDTKAYEDVISGFEAEAKTVLLVAEGKQLIGMIAVADRLKSGVKEAMNALASMGIETVMITGDNERTARAIGNQANIKQIVAGVTPDGKVQALESLQKTGRIVAMVGDGMNDAPALKQANVGIALGTGTDIAIEAADITLVSSEIDVVIKAITLSKATFKKIKENYFWAWIYNAIAIPFAMFGLLHPMIGAAMMSLSSLNVIYNSLRLKKTDLGRRTT